MKNKKGSQVKWTKFKELEPEAGGPAHSLEAVAVPGVVGEGNTPAEAMLSGLEMLAEVLGERTGVRGALLSRWLQGAESGVVKHLRSCRESQCAEGCLIGDTQEALRGDASLGLPKKAKRAA